MKSKKSRKAGEALTIVNVQARAIELWKADQKTFKKSESSAVELGRALMAVQAALPPGQYNPWLRQSGIDRNRASYCVRRVTKKDQKAKAKQAAKPKVVMLKQGMLLGFDGKVWTLDKWKADIVDDGEIAGPDYNVSMWMTPLPELTAEPTVEPLEESDEARVSDGITFNTVILKKALQRLSDVVARKTQEVQYRNVRLFIDDGGVKITGIDIDSTMTLRLPAVQDDKPFDILLPFEALKNTVSTLTTKKVAITAKGRLTAGSYSTNVGIPIKEPPQFIIAEKPKIGGYDFDLPGLKNQIGLVDFAVPAAERKQMPASALLTATAADFSVVGIDGTVLAISTVLADLGEFSFTMPKPALELIKKMDGTTVTISDTEDVFFFETTTELITYNKTHVTFPNYKGIFPPEPTVSVTFKDKAALVSALKRCTVTAGDKEHPGVDFSVDGSAVTLTTYKAEYEKTAPYFHEVLTGSESLPAESTGGRAKTRFNVNLLMPFLKRATFPVTLLIAEGNPDGKTDHEKTPPIDWHAAGSTRKNPGYRYLLMSMRMPAQCEPKTMAATAGK